MTASVPRLEPLPADEWDEHRRNLLRGRVQLADRYLSGAPDAPRMPNVLGVLGHHADLAGAWLAYNGVLLHQPVLDPRYRELMILRVAWRTRSDYEWDQHVRIARGLGVPSPQIDAVGEGAGSPVWSPLERLLLTTVDQLLDRHHVDDATWGRLAQRFDARELLEILFVVGSYLCLALVFNSVGLQPDPVSDRASTPAPPSTKGRS